MTTEVNQSCSMKKCQHDKYLIFTQELFPGELGNVPIYHSVAKWVGKGFQGCEHWNLITEEASGLKFLKVT